MKTSYLKLFAAVALTFAATMAGAQGTLRGVVTDSLDKDPLPGANVVLLGTALGNATNLVGEYRIDRVPEGTYKLRVSYIGYRPKELEVIVQGNATNVVNASLSIDLIEIATVVVTGQAEGQVAAINQQITSNTIVNVVSEQKIRELPDANAAESIGRLPGVSIIRSGGEANRVILRGLDAKFTNVTIDGVKIAATDSTSRGVDLSMLSQSSLAGIELFKALTPDKDGDALAGSINLVTKKAPESRKIKLDLRGNYNNLMEQLADQYDYSLHYGERFFNNALGVQLSGNLEKRIRSNERINVDYTQSPVEIDGYFIDDFLLEFTNEARKREGFSVLFDLNTPDDGTIRINNVYSRTKRDYLWARREFPSNGGGDISGQDGNPAYRYRDSEQEINTFNSSIRGDNSLLGLNLSWGASYAQSESEFPFDYETIFIEPSGMTASEKLRSNPEQLISHAVNNFSGANLAWAYDRTQRNFDKERTGFLDVAKKYLFSNTISGEIKIGGKYKTKDRSNRRTEDISPYYIAGHWKRYELLPDGTFRQKDFTSTLFEDWLNAGGGFIAVDQFFANQESRQVYGSYLLNPIIDRDRMRQWRELNKYGIDVTRNQSEIWPNPLIRYDDYSITEDVGAGYLMNTLNIGQKVTAIAGLRVEHENNDYLSSYMPRPVSGFPVRANTIRDTTSAAFQTVYLPNLNVAISPLDFMKVRVAAYKALARPDFSMRLNRYIAGRPAEASTEFRLFVGNPKLKTARAWNYEVNTSFFGNTIGLISLSAYYKEINDMYHLLNRFNTVGDTLLQRFDIQWKSQRGTSPYDLTLPYNSPKPTKVWGFEFEHQMNFRFLPGLLKNFVLSYNASIVRSETIIYGSQTISYVDSSGPIPLIKSRNILVEKKQKLEGMPEFFGNISLGYDIGRFSGRISVFHQGEHNVSYSATGISDRGTIAFTRLDLAFKQGITDNLSLFANFSNLTNIEDGSSLLDRLDGYKLFDQSEKYGLTTDFGLTLQLD